MVIITIIALGMTVFLLWISSIFGHYYYKSLGPVVHKYSPQASHNLAKAEFIPQQNPNTHFDKYFTQFYQLNKRPPSLKEASDWMHEQDRTVHTRYDGEGYGYYHYPFRNFVTDVFGQGPKDGYVITYIDHDNYHTYATWRKDIYTTQAMSEDTPALILMSISLLMAVTIVLSTYVVLKNMNAELEEHA